ARIPLQKSCCLRVARQFAKGRRSANCAREMRQRRRSQEAALGPQQLGPGAFSQRKPLIHLHFQHQLQRIPLRPRCHRCRARTKSFPTRGLPRNSHTRAGSLPPPPMTKTFTPVPLLRKETTNSTIVAAKRTVNPWHERKSSEVGNCSGNKLTE